MGCNMHEQIEPAEGSVYLFGGQRFVCQGQALGVWGWQSHCAECDEPFVTRTVRGNPPAVRRCETHRDSRRQVARLRFFIPASKDH